MVGIRCVGVSVVEFLSEDSFVCFGAKPDNGLAPEKTSSEQRGVSNSQGKVTVRERQVLREDLGPVDPKGSSGNVGEWVSVHDNSVGISLGYTFARATKSQMHWNARRVPKPSPFLRLDLTKICASLFFFLPLSVIYVNGTENYLY